MESEFINWFIALLNYRHSFFRHTSKRCVIFKVWKFSNICGKTQAQNFFFLPQKKSAFDLASKILFFVTHLFVTLILFKSSWVSEIYSNVHLLSSINETDKNCNNWREYSLLSLNFIVGLLAPLSMWHFNNCEKYRL